MIDCTSCGQAVEDGLKFCGNCGNSLGGEPVAAANAGLNSLLGQTLLGQYCMEKKLGEGGMGTVYLADQPSMDRKAVVKVLHPHMTSDEKWVERFNREAKIASKLSHPNSITLYNYGQTDEGYIYIAMEYIRGPDLSQIVEESGPMPLDRVVRIVDQVCGAMQEAHDLEIVHRDLKPDNILISTRSDKDWAKVLDFGIAKQKGQSDEEMQLTATGMVFGTPAYMSPEQFSGDELDFRSDLYSIGVMTFEMLTGKRPFAASTPIGYFKLHLEEPPPTMASINADVMVPPGVEAVIRRALEKDANHRQPNTQTFADELKAAVEAKDLPQASPQSVSVDIDAGAPSGLDLSDPLNRSPGLELALEPLDPAAPLPGLADLRTAAPPRPTADLSTVGAGYAGASILRTPSGQVAGRIKEARRAGGRRPAPRQSKLPLILVLILAGGGGAYALKRRSAESDKLADYVDQGDDPTAVSDVVGGGIDDETNKPIPGDPPPRDAGPITPAGMVSVEAGAYRLGKDREEGNAPHTVRLDPYFIDRDEVTNERYGKCVADRKCAKSRVANDKRFNGLRQPIVGVRFKDAQAFCRWDAGKRLPTPDEWEAAARGTEAHTFPWGDAWAPRRANVAGREDGHAQTANVGSFRTGNTLAGLRDMAGNAAEYVSNSGKSGRVRGGSYQSPGEQTASALLHEARRSKKRDNATGFRCVLDDD